MADFQTDRIDRLSQNINLLSAGLGVCTAVAFLVLIAVIGDRTGFVPWAGVLPIVGVLLACVGYLLRDFCGVPKSLD
jgi:hypothetical protein